VVALLIALSIAGAVPQPPAPPPAVMLSVPFLPQTEALCGGAAAAMVMRFLGDRHADVQQFASLVDRHAGGIAQNVLVDSLRSKGWSVTTEHGSIETLTARLRQGTPQILLIEDRPSRYHYVVAVGVDDGAVLVHDPTWGPGRRIPRDELLERWRPASYWIASIAQQVRPAARPLSAAADAAAVTESPRHYDDRCSALLNLALDGAAADLSAAENRLETMRAKCPDDPRSLRELAGVRFARKQWDAAAALAQQASGMDPDDRYTWDLLGSSRFMGNDLGGALQAWNHIGRPIVDRVQIDGLKRTRYSYLAEILGVTPNTLLTERTLQLARRRLEQLPDRASSRISMTPDPDGYAVVNAVVVERPRAPQGPVEWSAAAAQTAIDREIAVVVPGFTGQGEVWRASWRWWEHRPRVQFGFAAPLRGRTRGVWGVDFTRESQTYAAASALAVPPASSTLPLRETRTRGMMTLSNWLMPNLRVTAGAGLEAWNDAGHSVTFAGALDQRVFDDRLTVQGVLEAGRGVGDAPSYASATASLDAATSIETRGFVALGAASYTAVSNGAPFALWTGAGEGRARPGLLRAHSLLHDGVIDGAIFGRRVLTMNMEARRWIARARIVPVAVAGFVDAASAWNRLTDAPGRTSQIDAGAGIRLRLPGRDGTLRIDYARGLRDGANAFTIGWSTR
jgi:predicted double-glycine peptidase